MRLRACQLNRYLLHQSFVEGSVKGESLNAGTLCSQFVTTAFSLTIFMVLIFLAAQTMDMCCVSLENEQDHALIIRAQTLPKAWAFPQTWP